MRKSKFIVGNDTFCSLDLMNNSFYTYFINNEYVSSHQSIIFGFRQLKSMEIDALCSNISMQTNLSMISFNSSFNFSSNYKLRLYTSGCYYLDSNHNWLSDGLNVSFSQISEYFLNVNSVLGWFIDKSRSNPMLFDTC